MRSTLLKRRQAALLDATAAIARHWGRLDADRVWLGEGRGFQIEARQSAPPILAMICDWDLRLG